MDNKEPDINKKSKKKKHGKSFYVIFALCMVAMVGAAWSAYTSVSDYMEPSVIETKPKSTDASSEEAKAETQAEETAAETEPEAANVANQAETALPTDATEQATESEGSYFYPVNNEVAKKYSGSTPVKSETFGDYRTHNGTDFKTEKDASVHMITTGTVKTIKTDEIMGGTIITENNDGSISAYCGVTPSDGLKVGSHLSGGDVIGNVNGDIAGEAKDGVHIHLEISVDGKPVDPEEFLNNHSAT